jgi:hypothetical protein
MKLGSLVVSNYSVLQARQRIGRCFAKKRIPGNWLQGVTIYFAARGRSSSKANTAREEFNAAWEALKARTTPSPEQPEEAHVPDS